jgi:hypothetical protein
MISSNILVSVDSESLGNSDKLPIYTYIAPASRHRLVHTSCSLILAVRASLVATV